MHDLEVCCTFRSNYEDKRGAIAINVAAAIFMSL